MTVDGKHNSMVILRRRTAKTKKTNPNKPKKTKPKPNQTNKNNHSHNSSSMNPGYPTSTSWDSSAAASWPRRDLRHPGGCVRKRVRVLGGSTRRFLRIVCEETSRKGIFIPLKPTKLTFWKRNLCCFLLSSFLLNINKRKNIVPTYLLILPLLHHHFLEHFPPRPSSQPNPIVRPYSSPRSFHFTETFQDFVRSLHVHRSEESQSSSQGVARHLDRHLGKRFKERRQLKEGKGVFFQEMDRSKH